MLGIADFYSGRGDYEAAAGRYRSLLNEYPGLGLDAETLYFYDVGAADDREALN